MKHRVQFVPLFLKPLVVVLAHLDNSVASWRCVLRFSACSGHSWKSVLSHWRTRPSMQVVQWNLWTFWQPQDPSSYRPGHQWRSQRGGWGFTPPIRIENVFFYSRKVTVIKYYNLSLTTRKTNTLVTFGKAHLCCRWLNRYILTSL